MANVNCTSVVFHGIQNFALNCQYMLIKELLFLIISVFENFKI